MNKIMLFDMDGSLADYDKAMAKSLSEISDNIPDSFHNLDRYPIWKARKDLICSVPGWWKNLEPIPAGIELFNLAKSIGYDIMIATQCPKKPIAAKEKIEWIFEHLGTDTKFTLTRRKELIYGDILYDDYPVYMNKWLKRHPSGFGVMLNNKNNSDYTHTNVLKYNGDISEVSKILQNIFLKK